MDTKTTMDEKDVGLGLPNVQCSDGNKKSKKSKKNKKRKHSSSGSESDTPPKKLKSKKHKRKCKKKHKHAKDKKHRSEMTSQATETDSNEEEDTIVGPEIPKEILQKTQTMAPMSKEEWEKKQKTIKRVFDEATGRSRLIRGEGEIIEEIVSRERHQAINRQATQGDGDFFQSKIKKYI